MAYINWVEESQAQGEIKSVYENIYKKDNRTNVADILKCFSTHPKLLQKIDEISDLVHFQDQYLDRKTKEMIATLTSGLNNCHY